MEQLMAFRQASEGGMTEQWRNTAPRQDADHKQWTVVLSDTDNDLKSVQYTLWVVGVCNKKGKWKKSANNVRIVHTGDWLNKWFPEPRVTDYFQELQETAPKSCDVVLLNGNHEVEILQRSDEGYRTGLPDDHLEFIRNQDVMHVHGETLYLHGYPTFSLLRFLKQVREDDMGLNHFNQMIRKAFFEGEYALFREAEGLEMVGDIRKARKYYIRRCEDGETNGQKISRLLRELNIHTVVHGHRPNPLTQIDYELRIEIPGMRIIDNDNRPRRCGLGAALVDEAGTVMFVNPQEMLNAGGEKPFRKKIRALINP